MSALRYAPIYGLMLLCLVASEPLSAQAPETTLKNDGLGQLFFSENERQALDHAKRFTRQAQETSTTEPRPADPGPNTITVNGLVKPAQGPATSWINGHILLGNEEAGPRILTDSLNGNQVPIYIDGNRSIIELKVGQTWIRETGNIIDGYAGPTEQINQSPSLNEESETALEPASTDQPTPDLPNKEP